MRNQKVEKRERRHRRIRAKVKGTEARPRLAVFKSNRYLYGQLINDDKGVTVAAVSDAALSEKKSASASAKATKTERARLLGKALAEAAMKKKITTAVFDRGGFIYTGRIKAFAEGAREGGLLF
ncbi:MAG: 50S ribosomal protein L18 [Candidatus Lloydbacteria bacterium]|nr:50S ribosomal protein L18 [Candidatus Lloydbacteria bacterium]